MSEFEKGEPKLYSEPEEARQQVEQGEITPLYFWGQTRLFIPNELFASIGKDKLLELAESAFGKDEMDEFGPSITTWANSHSIDLPSVGDKIDGLNKQDERLEKLKKLIKESIV